MATSPLARALGSSVPLRSMRGLYHRRLTARGRFLLWATLALALVGVDTRRALVFMLFALAAPPLVLGLRLLVQDRPAVRLSVRIPARLTAGRSATTTIDAIADGSATLPLSVFWAAPLPASAGLDVTPVESCVETAAGRPARVRLTFTPRRRGRFVLPGLGVARTDPFGLVRSKAVWLPEQVLLAYPRYYTLDELPLPMGRRYQPGGIPLASAVGDSLEFVGTREYREGDPLRKIHWRSWGRLGKPVVKEYQEEYFSRIALVLDTFLPPPSSWAASASLPGSSLMSKPAAWPIACRASANERSRSTRSSRLLKAGSALVQAATCLACRSSSPARAWSAISLPEAALRK